ncbi:MAG: aminopeptidase N [Dehalococcoidia bacterium]
MTDAHPAAARDVLTLADAEARAARVTNCGYVLELDIEAGAETYRGDATITFDLSGDGDLFLDYRGKTIHALEVNGRAVDDPRWDGYRLWLPAGALAPRNQVRIRYENQYDHTGDGFHQFRDPEDGAEYLYSNFEPYAAHRLFPCFDQPDIKASYGLTVVAPAEWELVSNSAAEAVTDERDGRRRHRFLPTKPFSTYLFALVAGPYHRIQEDHNGIPIGLLCRRSLVKYLDADEVLTVTRQGLDFFAEFFDYPYPFGKYDQVFVPEFNAGAMENVGAITHNEYMVFRDPPTENQRRGRAEVILHEMAHMWFGDLVTMRWWNDLWLNESFATYMSYLALDRATRFTSGWQDFNASIKNWAYRQDQLVTTHPIAGAVNDTDETFLNFDGITYGKGASVIKQLVATIGIDGFREGMRRYFRRYAYGNATLGQFLAALEEGSGVDLARWSRLWLETASLNTIAAEWEARGNSLTRLTLTQSAPPDFPTLRPHRLDIGLLTDTGGQVQVEAIPARIDGERVDIAEARGKPRPALVFPNYGDHAYAKVALDPDSLAWLRANIERVDDDLLRQQLWSSLWSMVRDQQLRSTDYLDLVRSKLPHEPNLELVDSVLGQATAALGRYVPPEWREREAHATFEAALAALREAPEGDAKLIWARALINYALVPADIDFLGRLADGVEAIPGLTVDQDMRWSIAVRHMAFARPGAEERLNAEVARDPSDRGQRARLRGETSVPDPAVKASAWERFLGDGYGSLYLTVAAMTGFNWTHQQDILEPYVERFFEVVPSVFSERTREFATEFFGALFPSYRVEEAVLERSRRLLETLEPGQVVLRRMLLEANDEMERSLKCRAFART